MTEYRVSFTIKVPCNEIEKVKDWVRYNLGETGSLPGGNPLVDTSLEACFYSTTVRKITTTSEDPKTG